ncbi:cell division protein FtsL [Bacillus sp. FJAT-49736]|uniref:cell division protein FtsL n=1 Tax=Bacillus sp. FJAT-49736 TaxID=2833582 RepID=UPI001BC9A949|nr:cell division protein FtsL [Bacillus sp. FJAT-49736]MBS4172419.1 cell division protein FtsL [Bacillus sp. FJAT-49736]
MSNLARKQQYIEPQRQQTTQTNPQVQPIHTRKSITLGEKMLGILLVAFISVMAIKVISTQASIYKVNRDIQDLQSSVQSQKKINNDLKTQVSDLSRYDRIKKKAEKLGLKLNENNVKVVEGK